MRSRPVHANSPAALTFRAVNAPLQTRTTTRGHTAYVGQMVPDPALSRFVHIWRQTQIPVVYQRQKGQQLVVKLPYRWDNKHWLRGFGRTRPGWNSVYKTWNVPASWFEPIIRQALTRYGQVYVIQRHNESETCAPACWNARGIPCECSCMGAHHGAGHPGGRWYEVSETFAVRTWGRHLACRLITAV